LLGALALAYANSLDGPFVFDDTQPQGAFSWRARPLVWSSLALNRALGGSDTTGYHLFNHGVHAGATLLLLALLGRLLAHAAPGVGERARGGLALAAALFFGLHPLQTESVTYVSQRAESLAALFVLAFLYAFVRAAEAARASGWRALALVALALGFASKETAAVALPLAWLLERVPLGGVSGGARARLGFHGLLLAAWLALLATHVAGPLFAPESTSGFGVPGLTPLAYLCTQAGVLLLYLRLAFVPHPLCLDRAWPVALEWHAWLPQGLVVLALLAASAVGLARRSWLGLAGAWFFVALAPSSSLVPIRDLAVEHRTYLALAAPCLLASVAGWRLCRRLAPGWPRAPLVLAGAAALALGGLTARRNQDYDSAIRLWQSVVACAPHNPRAYENLSRPLIEAGRLEEARAALARVLELAPSALAYNNLAAIDMDAGRLDAAIATLSRAVVLEPGYDMTHANLGNCYLRRGEPERARPHFERALARLDSPYARRGLGLALLELGRPAEAARELERALELDPEDVHARQALARARAAR
jgi:tetratricopeptide (TPR) repeat protein